jgi:hypothetical protein
VDDVVLQGLYEAVARGEVGWLDIDPKYLIRPLRPGINLNARTASLGCDGDAADHTILVDREMRSGLVI